MRWCTKHQRHAVVEEAAKQSVLDARRGTAHERGYSSRWSAHARGFRAQFPIAAGYLTRTEFWTHNLAQHFHALRVMAAARGEFASFFTGVGAAWLEQFPIYAFHPSPVPEPSQEVDHIISVNGPADPLFWAEWNHQALSKRQHSEKTATHDGGFRGSPHAPIHHRPTANDGGVA